MTTLLLIRHGETDWNRDSVFRGQTDVPLNEEGLKQASLLARHLRNVRLAAIYSSPLKRASETAEMVASYHGIQVEKAAQLTDMNYGVWQGLPQHTAMEKYGELYDQWLRNPPPGQNPTRRNAAGCQGESVWLNIGGNGELRRRRCDGIPSGGQQSTDMRFAGTGRLTFLECATGYMWNHHVRLQEWNVRTHKTQ
jgi:hypothetical protein